MTKEFDLKFPKKFKSLSEKIEGNMLRYVDIKEAVELLKDWFYDEGCWSGGMIKHKIDEIFGKGLI